MVQQRHRPNLVVVWVSISTLSRLMLTVLNLLRRKLRKIYADGTYDSKASHLLVARKGAPLATKCNYTSP